MYIVIGGCGRVGAQLATMLSEDGHNVVVIDASGSSFRRLGAGFNGLTIVGNSFDENILEKAGIDKADIFVAVTNLDNTNIMAGQVAKKLYSVPRVIARVYYPDREKTYHKLGLETICGTTLVARKVRDWIAGRELTTEINLDRSSQIIEIKATPAIIGKRVSDIEIPNQFRPILLIRNEKTSIVSSETKIANGDKLVAAISADAAVKVCSLYDVEIHLKAGGSLTCPVGS